MSSSLCIKKENFHTNTLLSRLLELDQIPKELHIRGDLPDITLDEYGRATPRILTIVGSRKYTEYGKTVTEKLIASLQGENIIILSGLALGIDSIAHKAALKANIKTIAIPGSGLDTTVIYPASHRYLAKDIVAYGGSLLSELADTEKAAPWTFPARNRIMAALSDVVLVIEAEEKSGTLITARLALELGRDIGSVPGDIFSPTSKGTHSLLQDGATPITGESDLRALLHLQEANTSNSAKIIPENLSNDEAHILSLLHEPCNKDRLLAISQLPPPLFLTAFSLLEMKGYLQETFGEVRKIV
ncbi:MAG: hypothetical protein RLZZ308_246 [Candidatus Parcubacteria bacterium]|jgi:DNA processing protein